MLVLDGSPLHTADFGGSGKPVLLVHGLGGSHMNYFLLGPLLAQRARVIAIDLPGFGLSPVGAGTTFEGYVGLVTNAAGLLFGGTPPVLVGSSMGGAIVATAAWRNPHAATAAVLLGPALPALAAADLPWRQALALGAVIGPAGDRLVLARLRHLGPARMVAEMMRLTCEDPSKIGADVVEAHVRLAEHRAKQPWYGTAFRDAGRSIHRALARGGPVDLAFRDLRCPTVWIHGDKDRVMPSAVARRTAVSPAVRLEILEGIGHVPQLEAPSAVERLVRPLL